MLSKLWAPLEQPSAGQRGGWRQQARHRELAARAPDPGISRLGAHQLLEWCDGELSASKLQTVMESALQDGLKHPMVTRLGEIAAAQHSHSSLMDLLKTRTAILDDIVKPLRAHRRPPRRKSFWSWRQSGR